MRLIDADALQKLFNDVSTELLGKAPFDKDIEHQVRAFLMVAEMIADAPTIEAEPVRHGHWDEKALILDWCEDDVDIVYECSCGGTNEWKSPFCPHCGARMMDEVTG